MQTPVTCDNFALLSRANWGKTLIVNRNHHRTLEEAVVQRSPGGLSKISQYRVFRGDKGLYMAINCDVQPLQTTSSENYLPLTCNDAYRKR